MQGIAALWQLSHERGARGEALRPWSDEHAIAERTVVLAMRRHGDNALIQVPNSQPSTCVCVCVFVCVCLCVCVCVCMKYQSDAGGGVRAARDALAHGALPGEAPLGAPLLLYDSQA